jgi:hypothetical protein
VDGGEGLARYRRPNGLGEDFDTDFSQLLEGLANSRQGGTAIRRSGYVIEANYSAVFRHATAGLMQGADGAESGHVVERHEGGKRPASLQ